MIKDIKISDNQTIIKRFWAIIREKRLAHAYLFVGPQGVGKSETALGIAKFIDCEKSLKDTYCDACPSCIKINHGNHPDVHTIATSGAISIKIDQIRQLIKEVQLKPFEAKIKIFIVKDIDLLTHEASSALLKTLEEPTSQNLILLTTAFPENVLDTVKSRCHTINFFGLESSKLKAHLIKNCGLDERTSHFLAYFSEGCLGQAVVLNDRNVFTRKNETIEQFVFKRHNDAFIKEISGERDKERIQEVLDVLLSWFRDLILLKLNIQEIKLINYDRIKDLKSLENKYSFDDLTTLIYEIIQISRLSKENLNIKMALALLKERVWQN